MKSKCTKLVPLSVKSTKDQYAIVQGSQDPTRVLVRNLAFTVYHGVGFKVVNIEIVSRRVSIGVDPWWSMGWLHACARVGLRVLGGHGEAREPAWSEDYRLLPVRYRECVRRRWIRWVV